MCYPKCNRILVFKEDEPSAWEIVDIGNELTFQVTIITMLRNRGYSIKIIYPYFNVDDYIEEGITAGKSCDELFSEICKHSGLIIPAKKLT